MSNKMKLIALKQAIRTDMVSKESLLQASEEGMEKKIENWVKKGKPITFESLTEEVRKDRPFLDTMAMIGITLEDIEDIARKYLGRLPQIEQSVKSNPMKGIGRNEPCPCGSGKKYKKCCGR